LRSYGFSSKESFIIPFVFSGQAYSAAGSCATASISTPAWLGLDIVAGAVVVSYKLIDDDKRSKDGSAEKKSG